MIPLRDVNPSKGTPIVNYMLIAACVVAFVYELAHGPRLESFLFEYGLVPVRYSSRAVAAHFSYMDQVVPFFSSMFLHGGWLHLIGNIWVLYIFGDNVEGDLGHVLYLLFYILSGIIAGVIQVLTNLDSSIPTIGASGAVAGVMGAYFILYPRARILTFIPIFLLFYLVEVPAYVFLGFWFVLQFFNGAFTLLSGAQKFAGVAWWAHVGGFVGGVILVHIFLWRRIRASRRSL